MNHGNWHTPAINEERLATAMKAIFAKSDVIHGPLVYERADGHYMHGASSSGVPSQIHAMSVYLSERNKHPGLLLGKKRYTPMLISADDPELAAYSDVRDFAEALKTEDLNSVYYLPIRDHKGRLFVSGIASKTRKVSEMEARLIQSYCLKGLENVVKEIEPARNEKSILTPRERECLVFAARGFTEKQAAQMLSISPFTVHAHHQNAKHKLGARSKLGAVLKGLSLNEIMPADTEIA